MLIMDPETGHIIDANKAAVDFYQYSKEDLLQMNISQINHLPEDKLKHTLKNVEQEKENHLQLNHYLKSGEKKDVEVYSGPIEFNGNIVLCSIIHDITHRRLAEEHLRKNESTIRTMINATNSLVFLTDLQGNILNLNRQGAQLFNKVPDEMMGKNFKDYLDENDFSRIHSIAFKVVDSKKSITYQRTREDRNYEVSLYPVFNQEDEVNQICIFARDITDLKRTEKVFAAIETAGGICHEMNQPLQVILGNLELLKLNLPKDDTNQQFIDTLVKHTERLGIITKKLTHITRYETKKYIKGTIFDIDKSTQINTD